MRRFSFFRRNGIFYCQLYNELTGKWGTAKSTGARSKDDAYLVAADWLKSGIPSGQTRMLRPAREAFTLDMILTYIRGACTLSDAEKILGALNAKGFTEGAVLKGSPASIRAVDFLRTFWDEERSPYVKSERSRGRIISLRHIRESGLIVEKRWAPLLGEIQLGALSKADIRQALVKLSESGGEGGKPLAPATVIEAYACISTAIKWAYENDIIPTNPCEGVRRPVSRGTEKGILTDQEIADLFSLDWQDQRGKVAFLVGATTGLRRGEIIALQLQDVGEDRLFIRHAWNDDDRLKAPKNGKVRESPLLSEVREALLAHARSNPHGFKADSFIFYGLRPERPMDGQLVSRAFDLALERIGIDNDERMKRGLSFHSLRHGYAKAMALRVETQTAMKATGHATAAMLEHYAAHKSEQDLEAIAKAQRQAFGKVLSFRKGA